MSAYTAESFRHEAGMILRKIRSKTDLESTRRRLYSAISAYQFEATSTSAIGSRVIVARDCARSLRGVLTERSDHLADFSVAQAIWDVARARPRPDLQAGFYAEMIHLFRGLMGKVDLNLIDSDLHLGLGGGRTEALARSEELDDLWANVESNMARHPDGLREDSIARRASRRAHVLKETGGTEADWNDWRWQVSHIIRDAGTLSRLVRLSPGERKNVEAARASSLPFGITPYYASLMDDDPETGRDQAIRAQVLPPADYIGNMSASRHERKELQDFMREQDTSPVELITRRYPAIAILKPFNTCPQICVYCQRNWEIEDAMAPGALAPRATIEAACDWLEAHPAVREVLVTGGDPMALEDSELLFVLRRLAAIKSVDLIRIGTRTPVTMPMRITESLADSLGALRNPGYREICLITHIQHPYEVTPEVAAVADRLQTRGITVYNQLVFTYFISRRFEAAHLRLVLRRSNVDPYYTFVPKGKGETGTYRVPVARILQEQQEEARLLPGTRRSDEPVYNLPALGKNYLRAAQHRDLISIRPNGARVYEFHPWEKNVVERPAYVGDDVPILDYLARLVASGEDMKDYDSIWYYF